MTDSRGLDVRVHSEDEARPLLEAGGRLLRLGHDMVAMTANALDPPEFASGLRAVRCADVDVDELVCAAAQATPVEHVDAAIWERVDRTAHWRSILGSTHERLVDDASRVVLDERGAVVAAAVVSHKLPLQWWPGGSWVQEVFVVPRSQGRGIGAALLDHALWGSRVNGEDRMGLTVTEGNPAERLYRRLGFVRFRSTWQITEP